MVGAVTEMKQRNKFLVVAVLDFEGLCCPVTRSARIRITNSKYIQGHHSKKHNLYRLNGYDVLYMEYPFSKALQLQRWTNSHLRMSVGLFSICLRDVFIHLSSGNCCY